MKCVWIVNVVKNLWMDKTSIINIIKMEEELRLRVKINFYNVNKILDRFIFKRTTTIYESISAFLVGSDTRDMQFRFYKNIIVS